MSHSVGDVARLAGVTIRTLHHYDDIGLLTPSGRTPAGYRRYVDSDLERLQGILCYRALGFDLATIATLMDERDADPLEHMRRQRALLTTEIERLQRMIATLDRTMEARTMGINLNPEELFEVFGADDPTRHAEEAEQRWGESEAYRESQRRTRGYSKADWLRIRDEGAHIDRALVALLQAGAAPDSEAAMDLAEQHRQHIGRWFYDCTPAVHCGLADMYVADPRFTESYERQAVGLSAFVRGAIHANARRAGHEPDPAG